MTEHKEMICPECKGEKVISGTCTCDNEWRGSMSGNEWEGCKCAPEITCPKCQGTGYVAAGGTCHD
ncbi:MAG: ankyrin [Thermodesulfobacteriota bacterium]